MNAIETITQIIPEPPKQYKNRQRYISKHANRVGGETACWKSNHRILGTPKVFRKPPTQYLKKNSRIKCCITVKHVHPRSSVKQSKLPSRISTKNAHHSLMALPQDPSASGRVNFSKRNISNISTLKPPQNLPKYVDTRFGDKHDFCSSGLVPVYILKKGYGKLPKYIKFAKHSIEGANEHQYSSDTNTGERAARTLNAGAGDKGRRRGSQVSYYPVPENERRKLLDGLKKKWNETMERFRCLPFLIDTVPKAQRKTKMERELEVLEKDIAFIEGHRFMYICDGADDGDKSDEKQ